MFFEVFCLVLSEIFTWVKSEKKVTLAKPHVNTPNTPKHAPRNIITTTFFLFFLQFLFFSNFSNAPYRRLPFHNTRITLATMLIIHFPLNNNALIFPSYFDIRTETFFKTVTLLCLTSKSRTCGC